MTTSSAFTYHHIPWESEIGNRILDGVAAFAYDQFIGRLKGMEIGGTYRQVGGCLYDGWRMLAWLCFYWGWKARVEYMQCDGNYINHW
ncbi:hypothetical protein EYC84_000989 [Monilinia fructicola]|uniref:Uncharacterized protein n=1 Tax=Monilinia fructicola TaxID=38448 RepID=A0A5M9JKT2_MONFR|nr:hypothetical protein EYC84_000989 [Monilinia fructicola]